MLNVIPVVHVPYTFFPDPSGGTEIYVSALIAEMRKRSGFDGVVAAPAAAESSYVHNDIRVFRFNTDPRPTLDSAYGKPDEIAVRSFRSVLLQVRPRIVHLHANTAAVSVRLMDEARSTGAKTVFTYHTPTASCLRGTMMFMGKSACDGILNAARCTECQLESHGVPQWAGKLAARIPAASGNLIMNLGLSGPMLTALRIPDLTARAQERFRCLMQKSDCVVAVCHWVKEVLVANGVPEPKLVLCRQGLPMEANLPAAARHQRGQVGQGILRLGYFGRLDPSKGLDIVVEALRAIPDAPLTLEVYGVEQSLSADYAERLRRMADSRVRFRATLPPHDVAAAMAECDFIVVPSRCLETGPLVVYEAFAAGTPVLGTRAGGIAELVSDGSDGILIANSSTDWARVIGELAQNPIRVQQLRNSVRQPRTMADTASEMAAHYNAVLAAA
jgi:glycosyltransferase involved in cell wall biosynthesis